MAEHVDEWVAQGIYERVAKVVSMEKDSSLLIKYFILSNISLPASMATPSGLNGDRPFAISSALTNSFTKRLFGKIVIDAVVFPAPLQPAIIYKCLAMIIKWLKHSGTTSDVL